MAGERTGTARAVAHTDELRMWTGEDVDFETVDSTLDLDPELDSDLDVDLDADIVPGRELVPAAAPETLQVQASATRSASPEPPRAATASPVRGASRRRRLVTLLGVVAAGAVVFGVYSAGKPSVPTFAGNAAEEQSASPQVDQAKVADLMKKISANARDLASLQALADLYFQAGDYKSAIGWENKVLAIDPRNTQALLGLGASQFNVGNSSEAEKDWLKVVAIDPNKAEAHYDLGFLYLSKTPPDMSKVTVEWQKVVAIDPTSDIAKTVSTHLKSLKSVPSTGTAGKK